VEEALKQSEEKYRTILENIEEGYYEVDIAGNFTFLNDSMYRIFGYPKEELIGMNDRQYTDQETAKRLFQAYNKVYRTGIPDRGYDYEIIRKDRTKRYLEVSISLQKDSSGKTIGFKGIIRDITEHKRAEEDLRRSEKKFKELFDNAPVGYHEFNIEGRITNVNRTELEMLGYTLEERIGQFVWSSITEEEKSRQTIFGKLAGVIPPSRSLERIYRRKDGTTFPALIQDQLLLNEKGRITGIRSTNQDITERKRAEEERRSLEAKLQRAQKMEALGLMAGGVAHDLNNMLSAIVSLPELILMDIPKEDQKLRRRMQMIMSSGEKISTIVDNLLTLTRGVTMAQDALNLNKVVQEYMRSPEFEKLRQFHPKVEVVTELADDLLPIRGERVHLMKTLMNLVSNASEAIRTSDSGVVSVSTQNRYVDAPLEGYERVNIGEYAVLVVKDNGMGISPQDMERIFEPFYTKKVMGRSGTGLGLSVVWNTVTDHGGYIHVESGGGGTVFELYFPITRESVSEQEKPLDLEQYKGRGEKVLVVDDEPDQRVIAVDILSKLGYQAEAVSGGQEALEFLKEHEVDILLLDMLMPGMDGCDTFSQIVQLKPGQKAVIASGFSLSDRVKKAQELGAGAYIRKPYSIEKLGMAIKTELDK
jgi:PAS domain S-box-containing protein